MTQPVLFYSRINNTLDISSEIYLAITFNSSIGTAGTATVVSRIITVVEVESLIADELDILSHIITSINKDSFITVTLNQTSHI